MRSKLLLTCLQRPPARRAHMALHDRSARPAGALSESLCVIQVRSTGLVKV